MFHLVFLRMGSLLDWSYDRAELGFFILGAQTLRRRRLPRPTPTPTPTPMLASCVVRTFFGLHKRNITHSLVCLLLMLRVFLSLFLSFCLTVFLSLLFKWKSHFTLCTFLAFILFCSTGHAFKKLFSWRLSTTPTPTTTAAAAATLEHHRGSWPGFAGKALTRRHEAAVANKSFQQLWKYNNRNFYLGSKLL